MRKVFLVLAASTILIFPAVAGDLASGPRNPGDKVGQATTTKRILMKWFVR